VRNSRRLFFLSMGALLTLNFACVTADEKKPETPLEVLNGEKYQPVIGVATVGKVPLSGPFVTRKNSATAITGKIVENTAQGYYKRPVKFRSIFIRKGDVEFKTGTDEFGEFHFMEEMANGTWEIRVDKCEEKSKSIEIKSYEIDIGEWEVVCKKQGV
jgi:hypothetical protein